jgi:hypothetical protein
MEESAGGAAAAGKHGPLRAETALGLSPPE